MDNKTFVIAIDGPLGSGKGTLAKKVASKLGGFYLYTGAMYRSIALYCLESGYNLIDEQAVLSVLPKVSFKFQDGKVFLNDRDVTERITFPDVASGASVIAVFPTLRKEMVLKQQQLAEEAMEKGLIVVAEGRDTGTKVFPDSPFKVYLTSSEKIRAERRLKQYQAQGEVTSIEEVLADTRERDVRDTERLVDPLPKNPSEFGYFILDNSEMSEEQTLNTLFEELRRRQLL